MRSNISYCSLLIAAIITLGGCSTAPSSAEDKNDLNTECIAAMKAFNTDDNTLGPLVQNSYGYAILPSIVKGAVGVGGAYGKGQVYEQGTQVGFTDVSQGSVGFQAGGQAYSELLVFQDKESLDKFKTGDFAFSGNASAVAATAGAAGAAKFENGVAVFVRVNGGLMYEASIGGQKFSYSPLQAQQ
jgi:lipid-binding SYLF domain-containing protein